MDVHNLKRAPPELFLTAVLTSGLTIGLSTIYSLLCIIAMVFRFNCNAGLPSATDGSSYFINTIHRVYIQMDSCENTETLGDLELMSPDTFFIFVIVTLVISVCTCAAAITLLLVVSDGNKSEYIHASSWVYIVLCTASLVVDIIFAVFFGLDFNTLVTRMNASSPGVSINYRFDVLRLGSLLFMSISLKGYVAHAVNIILLVLLGVYVTAFKSKNSQREEHSIHKMGAINAYGINTQQRRHEDWHQQPDPDLPYASGPHMNPAYINDENPRRGPRSPMRDAPMPMSDYSNRSYDRSDSWHHSQGSSRPFSYLEENRKPAVKPSPSPSPSVEQWRREPWGSVPPMPAPDYSPPSRRLKSALKPNYM